MQTDLAIIQCEVMNNLIKHPNFLSGIISAILLYLFSLWVPLIYDFYFEWVAGDFFQAFKPRTFLGSIFNLFHWRDGAFTITKVLALWGWLTLITNQFIRVFLGADNNVRLYKFGIVLALCFIFSFSTISQMTFGPVRILDSIPYFLILAGYLICAQNKQSLKALSYVGATILFFLATLIHEKSIFDLTILLIWVAWRDGIKKSVTSILPAFLLSIAFLLLNRASGTTGLGYAPNTYLDTLSNGLNYFLNSSYSPSAIIFGGGSLWVIYIICSVQFVRCAPTNMQLLTRLGLCIGMLIICILPLLVAFDTNRLVGLIWLPTFLLLCQVGPKLLPTSKKLSIFMLICLCALQLAVPPMLTMPPLGSVVFNSYAKWFAGPRSIVADFPIRPGQILEFKDQGNGSHFLDKGWHGTEAWGVWSNQADSTVTLQNLDPNIKQLFITMKSLVISDVPKQEVEIRINGRLAKSVEFKDLNSQTILIPLSEPIIPRQPLEIQFHASRVITPKKAGISADDTRPLGIGLITIQVQ